MLRYDIISPDDPTEEMRPRARPQPYPAWAVLALVALGSLVVSVASG